ncbi:hypothetical protein LguiA_007260 [Lonicera macranthoides]
MVGKLNQNRMRREKLERGGYNEEEKRITRVGGEDGEKWCDGVDDENSKDGGGCRQK